MVQSVSKEKKALLSSNNGHARSEIRDETKKERVRIDATPTIKEDGEKSHENAQEERQNDQDAENNFNDEEGEKTEEGKEKNGKNK